MNDILSRAGRLVLVAGLVVGLHPARAAAAFKVAKLTGARVLVIPGDVGWTPQAKTYQSYIDALVRGMGEALR